MHCKACDSQFILYIRTDHPEHDGILWEELCQECRRVAGVAEIMSEWSAENEGEEIGTTPIQYSPIYATSLEDMKDLLDEWVVGGVDDSRSD